MKRKTIAVVLLVMASWDLKRTIDLLCSNTDLFKKIKKEDLTKVFTSKTFLAMIYQVTGNILLISFIISTWSQL